jgi:hypothetical protein
MLEAFILASSLLICGNAQQGADMDDEDFASFLQFHDDIRIQHGESAAKGCLGGAIGGAPGGFAALCIGCATGAAANVAQDVIFNGNDKK